MHLKIHYSRRPLDSESLAPEESSNPTTSPFEEAAEEIDRLSLEGYFGDDVRELVDQRSHLSTPDFLALCVGEWLAKENQFRQGRVIHLIGLFLRLYAESIRQWEQSSIDSLTYFLKGFPENPETECLSAFLELTSSYREIKDIARQVINGMEVTTALKVRVGREVARAYQNSVEFMNKMLTILLLLLKMPERASEKALVIYGSPLAQKIEEFLKLSDGRYDEIVEPIDREIRNAESHLDMRFIAQKGEFVYKVRDRGRTRLKRVSATSLFLKLLALGGINQAFIYSACLLVLAGTRPSKYRELTGKISSMT